jgi:hypothetical protein
VPEEVRAAKRINQEGERIIEKAQEEAERIVARAQEQAAYLIGERGLTDAAEDESRRIVADAEADAADVRAGADDYAAGVLEGLQSSVGATLAQIERGIEMLEQRRASYLPAPEDEPAPDDGYAPLAEDDYENEAEGTSPAARR